MSYDELEIRVNYPHFNHVVSGDFPSAPCLSPDGRRFVFISPCQWEMIGQVFLYEADFRRKITLVRASQMPKDHTPKQALWLDDETILLVIGFAYGTVSVGGDLYALALNNNNLLLAYRAGEHREVKDVYVEADAILMTVVTFNQDATQFRTQIVRMDVSELKGAHH